MLATYAAALAVCASSLLIGQAAVTLCGRRGWSWLAPAVGLALVLALCWATVEFPGEGRTAAIFVLVAAVASLAYLRGRVPDARDALRVGGPVALGALVLASIPFAAEGHFGILGTSFNPDMSQHLLAASRMSEGFASQLSAQGYPMGPHAIATAADGGLNTGLVAGFSGLTVATAVLACLTALGLFRSAGDVRRGVAALLVGLPYLVASFFAQGAFKEMIEALFVLAFALGLADLARGSGEERPLAAVPLGLIAGGAVFAYSFPGLLWLGLTLLIWGVAGVLAAAGPERRTLLRTTAAPAGIALAVFAALTLSELPRMIDFRSFETFDPTGPGLGNLFGQVSPAEALGFWPTGDFRLGAGDGAVPAAGYWAGAALGLALLGWGIVWSWRRRSLALPAALVAAAAVYLAARLDGTAYQAAKAVMIAAPIAMALILAPWAPERGQPAAGLGGDRRARRLGPLAAGAFALGAGLCSVLGLANAPVGPSDYSPKLTQLRGLIGTDPTYVLAPAELIDEQHGVPYISWELRGGRICIASEGRAGGPAPPGVVYVVSPAAAGREPPFRGLLFVRGAGPWLVWERSTAPRGPSDCPLIAVRQARNGA